MVLVLLLAGLPALAQDTRPISILEQHELLVEHGTASPSHHLTLTLAYLEGGGWEPEAIRSAVLQSARILAQCGVALTKVEMVRIDAPVRFRDYYTPLSRELARALPLARPTVYFVADTRQRPAFEAEAIGRGNSRTRPELMDTVWITRSARDLGIVLVHELSHVLMDSGEHSEEPGNLMREDTTRENTRLSDAQCARLRDTGSVNGLIAPLR